MTRVYRLIAKGIEVCYHIGSSRPITKSELLLLHELICDPSSPRHTRSQPFFSDEKVVSIGAQPSFESPFSSNAVAIVAARGLTHVSRIEPVVRYVVQGTTREKIRRTHLDPMTQEEYPAGIESFAPTREPEQVYRIPISLDGEHDALRVFSEARGLGMDDWDIAFYRNLFKTLGRNPTTVELYQLGNMNSEHSRHPFFKGRHTVNGITMPTSLFELIRRPLHLLEAQHNTRSVLAFNDNSGASLGFTVPVLRPTLPGTCSYVDVQDAELLIIFTAETHNHPTLFAPFPGAATGVGGRIRDVVATGRGARIVAGAAGYFVGNLLIPGYPIPGEKVGGENVASRASALEILLEGIAGAAHYGNCIGEPCILGTTRTFEQDVGGTRYGFRKPILYSAGQGRLDRTQATKAEPENGMLIVAIGGPACRVGMSGGSASSISAGKNETELDRASVQRGNPEEENRALRVIRACSELGKNNPILSIHDQGAGGPSNVITELMGNNGGAVDIRRIVSSDPTLSVAELWVAEYQERFGMLVHNDGLAVLEEICTRERVSCEVLGEITGSGRVIVTDSRDGSTPVDLPLTEVLTAFPNKSLRLTSTEAVHPPLSLPADLSVRDALEMVLKLPSVGSKGFITNHKDRSVTGLVAQQQCCGPLLLPVADCAITADSYFAVSGATMAIGERPTIMLIDPQAGARMTAMEFLQNLAGSGIESVKDVQGVRCRANWMSAAKEPGQGARLYEAVQALSEAMVAFGFAADGGKDSLSMAMDIGTETVIAPGTLILFGGARVSDITRAVTPDCKRPGKSAFGFIDPSRGNMRLGGSALAQAHDQLGNEAPDVDDIPYAVACLAAVQELVHDGLALSLHDRSDGGIITTVLEMLLAGNCGGHLGVPRNTDPLTWLFNEEAGWVFEYNPLRREDIRSILARHGVDMSDVGVTLQERHKRFVVTAFNKSLFNEELSTVLRMWERTSSVLEALQTMNGLAEEEYAIAPAHMRTPAYRLTFTPEATLPLLLGASNKPKVAVIREEGSNGDEEMRAAFYAAGFDVADMMMSDVRDRNVVTLDEYQGVVFPGGFAHMDVFGSARGWVWGMEEERIAHLFQRFYARQDTFSLGVCNGFQLMTQLGWVPFGGLPKAKRPQLLVNDSGRFESRFGAVRIQKSPAIMFRGMEDSVLGVWIAHGEGKLHFPDVDIGAQVLSGGLAPLVYTDTEGNTTEQYPSNPNGSLYGLAGLCSRNGRHLAMMPHPERCFLTWQWPWMPEDWKRDLKASPWLRMFQNAYDWCRSH